MFQFSRVATAQLAGARFLSTAATHAPPKKLYGNSGRYAMAAYTAASKNGVLDRVESELVAFAEVVKKNQNIAAFLHNPTIPRPEKSAKLTALFDDKFSHITRNLFITLSDNGRAADALHVISSYVELMQAARGSTSVSIISAEPLKKKQLEAVQAAVTKIVGDKKTIDLKVVVDDRILGGLQVLIDDKFLDLSVASRVSDLSKTLDSAN